METPDVADVTNDPAVSERLNKNSDRQIKIFSMLAWKDKDENKDKKDKIDKINEFDEKHIELSAKDQADPIEIKELDADIDKFIKENKVETVTVSEMGGGRRRSSSARKSSSRRGRRSAKKRGTKRKQKRRQRRASRRAY